MHVAITGMHVQSHPNAAFEHALVNGNAFVKNRLECCPRKNALERQFNLGFPTGAQSMVLQLGEQGVHTLQPSLPQVAHITHHRQGLTDAFFQQLSGSNLAGVVVLTQRQIAFA